MFLAFNKPEKPMQRFFFNTGVRAPYLARFKHINRHGQGLIAFYCQNVPDGAVFHSACNDPELYNREGFIVREIHNSALHSRYANFRV